MFIASIKVHIDSFILVLSTLLRRFLKMNKNVTKVKLIVLNNEHYNFMNEHNLFCETSEENIEARKMLLKHCQDHCYVSHMKY